MSDFGLSVTLRNGIGERLPVSGKSYWRAPELAKKDKQDNKKIQYTSSVDIFSYGMILWELFNIGKFPWNGEDDIVYCLDFSLFTV